MNNISKFVVVSLLLSSVLMPVLGGRTKKHLKKKAYKKYKGGQHSACYKVKVHFKWEEDCPLPNGAQEHFSPVIGCTHNKKDPFLNIGELATSGVENVAETGNPTQLISEISQLIEHGKCHKQVGPYGPTNSPGVLEFDIT